MPTDVPFTHPILSVETFPVQGPDRVHRYVRLRTPDWVNCVPVTTDGEVVLVRQHRHGIDEVTLEIPGGAVDPGEDPETAARRALREETGYGGGQVHDLGWVHVNPAIHTNRTSFFLFDGVRLVGEQDTDPTEDITVETVPVDAIEDLLREGRIRHSLAVVALQRALLEGLVPRRRTHGD